MKEIQRMADIITKIDDLDETPGAKPATLGFDWLDDDDKPQSWTRQIDLSATNLSELVEFLEKYRVAGRPVAALKTEASRKRRTPPPRTNQNKESAKIREWANQNGHNLPERGRIPDDVIAAYHAAHGTTQTAAPAEARPSAQGAAAAPANPQFTSV